MLATLLGPLLAALLSFVAWQPFVRPDFDLWKADDGEYHLLRVYVFERAVKAGEWLPRWVPDLFVGYGYPLFNYYAPGTYYLALVPRALGLDIYTTIQVLGAAAACAGAAGAYCLARAIFGGRLPGLVAALAYVYAPYPFITNLIIRADLAETLGLALLPWVLLAAWQAGRQPSQGRLLALAAAMAAILLTHNLTALVALPAALLTGCFAALRAARPGAPRAWWPGGAAVAGGLGLALALTAFFWLPALAEQRYVQIEVALQSGHKSPRSWLIDPLGATEQTQRAGNPQTIRGPLDLHLSYPYDLNYPPKPSLGQGALFVAAGLALAHGLLRRRPAAGETAFFFGGTLVLWLATTTWSGWAWEHVPLMRFLQFSWRLYGPLALALALAAAGAAALLSPGARCDEPATPVDTPAPLRSPGAGSPMAAAGRGRWLTALVLRGASFVPLGLAILLALNTTTARPLWIDPHVERRVGGPQLVGTENTLFGAGTTTGGEFVPRAANLEAFGPGQRRGNGVYERLYPEFGWLAGRTWVLDGQLEVTALASGPTWTNVQVEAQTPGTLAFRTIAFPGWHAYLDGRAVQPRLAPRDEALGVSPGFLTVAVPAGRHEVQIAFGPTRLRSAAGLISLLALAWMGWWLIGAAARAGGRPGRSLLAQRGRSSRSPVAGRLGVVAAPAAGPALMAALVAFVAFVAVAWAHDAIRPALGAPVQPRPADNRLVADVAALAAQGSSLVAISSPSGPALGPFVNVQRLAIGGRERRWLYMHPPSSVSVTLTLPPRAAFQAGLGLDPRTWTADGADGVIFALDVTVEGAAPQRVFEEHVNPRARGEDRAWLDRWIDLSAFGGKRATLTLRTDPAQTPDFDWAGWADPVVMIQSDARRPGGGAPGPLPTPRSS